MDPDLKYSELDKDLIDRQRSLARGKISLGKDFMFEAAHVLPKHDGKCANLHGHSWKLTVVVDGYVDMETGFVLDYAKLKKIVQHNIIDYVDHAYLGHGNIEGLLRTFPAVYGKDFYPSSENLIQAFRRVLEPYIPELGHRWQDIALLSLTINETCTSACTWRRANA